MRHLKKIILLAGVLVFGLTRSVWAFSLGGPIANGGDSWQSQVIGYGLGGDLNAPKNIGEGYRRNTSVMYYAVDANFADFFGTNGLGALQSAFSVLNSTFTNNPTGVTSGLDGYSASLAEFPLNSLHYNYQAQALGLYDVKSTVFSMMMEQLGLADPIRYDWTLHTRFLLPNTTCPAGEVYLTVQRNFDTGGYPVPGSSTVDSLYSPYVDGTLYSYQIFEDCTGPNPLALAEPIVVDPTSQNFSPVGSENAIFQYGAFYTGLTRDDVMGLRYLLSTNLINFESVAANGLITVSTTNFNNEVEFPVNPNSPNGFGTFDLGTLLSTASTTDPALIPILFPGVVVASSSSQLVLVTNVAVISYFTNFPGSQAGSPPTLVVTTSSTVAPTLIFSDTFANVITNNYSPNTTFTVQQITVAPVKGGQAGNPSITNITFQTVVVSNLPSGDYYLVPTNQCGFDIIGTLFTNVFSVTNTVSAAATNTTTGTNSTFLSFTQNVVETLTNVIFITHPVTCSQTAGASGLYQGVGKIDFVYSSFDSLVGQFFQPITNIYTMLAVTNSQVQSQTITRVVTTPDILFSALDLVGNPPPPFGVSTFQRNLNFDTANVLNNLAGPGTITTPTTISFNKSGPVYFNAFSGSLIGNPFLTEAPGGGNAGYGDYFVWASYDGTTNAPVVYPNSTSINQLQNQILIQVTPSTLPNGTNGVVYATQYFSASGGSFTPPYTWSASGLPAGLTISSGGILFGTPTQTGTNLTVTVTLTDTLSRTVQWNYPLNILSPTP